VRRWFGHLSNRLRNSITGLLVGLVTLVAAVCANMTYASSVGSGLVFILFVFGYVVIYMRMVRHYWLMRPFYF
jgi:hypothetical protein